MFFRFANTIFVGKNDKTWNLTPCALHPSGETIHDEQHKQTNVQKGLRRDHWDRYLEGKISENYH